MVFKSNILYDRQELSNISHHKIAFDYDEDTTSLVIEPTLTMVETLLSNNSNFSAENAPTTLEYYCNEIETDKP
jgi:hypothetical protein